VIVGAVLFVNARLLLGKVDAQGAPVLHLFVGGLQTAIPFHLIARVRVTGLVFFRPAIGKNDQPCPTQGAAATRGAAGPSRRVGPGPGTPGRPGVQSV